MRFEKLQYVPQKTGSYSADAEGSFHEGSPHREHQLSRCVSQHANRIRIKNNSAALWLICSKRMFPESFAIRT